MSRGLNGLYHDIKGVLGLSVSLASANFKLRNEGSYLGIFWYLIEPLSMFLIFLVLGGALTSVSVPQYPLYLLIGLLMYNFFLGTTSAATRAITSNEGFIKSMKIRQEAFVVSCVIQFVFSHAFEMVIYALFMAYFGVSLVGLLFYPIIFGLFCLLILGLSFAFSTIGVYANDLGNVWVVIGRMLFFLTPIFYAPSGEGAVFLFNRINPLFQFINLARDVMVYGAWPATTNLAYVLSLSVLTFLLGLSLFQRYKRSFAERL